MPLRMLYRALLLRIARAAGFASAYGIAVMTVLHALKQIGGNFSRTYTGPSALPFDAQLIPKPEELGWLVGALALVALLTLPRLARGPWWAWGLVRALAGTLAFALPVDAVARASGVELDWWHYIVFWGPLFLGLLATAAPEPRELAPKRAPHDDDVSA